MRRSDRLLPEFPFPAYTYVPGKQPHPFSDPRGHRFGHDLPPETTNAASFASSIRFRLGIDLFNHGYYWEAHEIWETCWREVGPPTATGRFLKALIQWAVVGVKALQGQPENMAKHAHRAVELLENLVDQESLAGFSIARLLATSRQWWTTILVENALPERFSLFRDESIEG